jgi:hypothetical protein
MRLHKTVVIGALFIAAVIGYLVWSTFSAPRYRCEVCITFAGRQACRTAGAATRDEARQTATVNACGLLSSGVTESTQCQSTPPDRVRWLQAR